MATFSRVKRPSRAQHLGADAEAGPGAMAPNNGQTVSATDIAREQAMSGASDSSPSDSSEAVADNRKPAESSPDKETKRGTAKTVLLMTALCLAVFLAALDNTIVTTALPTISSHYHASSADYTWIGSSYLLAAAAATPSWGKISDIFGRKPIILIANVVFFVGSIICATSMSVTILLTGRVIQGIGGGGLIILVNICISDLFSIRNRGIYYGLVGMVWAIASGLGPVLGGIFTQFVSWRWCFYINLPLDGIAFLILFLFLDIETPRTPLFRGLKAIDWFGSLSIIGGTVMFLLGLEFGGVSYPWTSATVVCLIVFGVFTIGLFFVIEWKYAEYPVMPIHLFQKRSNVAALLTCFCHGFTFVSGSFFLPLYFQAVLGATPLLSGVYLFPFVLSLSFVSAAVGIVIKKTGQYLPLIWFGMAFMALGFGLFIDLPHGKSWARIVIFQIIAGIGVGPNFQAPLIALQSLVPPQDIATATATFGFTRNLATSISVVIGGVIFQNQMAKQSATLLAALGPQVAGEVSGGSAGANTAIIASLPPNEREVATLAYMESLRTMWIFYCCIAAFGFLISLMISRQRLSKRHETVKTGLEAQEHAKQERLEEKRRSLASSMRVIDGPASPRSSMWPKSPKIQDLPEAKQEV